MKFKVEIIKGKDSLKTADKINDIIEKLPISNADNDALIEAILEHTHAASREAYAQGVSDTLNSDIMQKFAEQTTKGKATKKRLEIKH